MRLRADTACLMIVDVQEKLLPAMHEGERVVERCVLLMEAARRLAVPILVTEQYPQGLGPTVPRLKALMPNAGAMPKLHFSCVADEDIRRQLLGQGRPQVVIAGIETHVCVMQTALDLVDLGLRPFVVDDATASRKPESKAVAVARLTRNGADMVTAEMVLFEWLDRAGTPAFKDLSRLVR
ncbi:MAG: hydrolase [Alphaproteobacteria bacterium]|nr:hydrolase [Alphaproteobacteria bacterium]